ncbi:MAG: hypothetical protein NTY46_05400 [Candidatus Sumerlaeota bacterium]|nr:hypothetical protein [Candidatus Sumerlaeota bacterium]
MQHPTGPFRVLHNPQTWAIASTLVSALVAFHVLTEAQGYAIIKSAVELGIGFVGGSLAAQLRLAANIKEKGPPT